MRVTILIITLSVFAHTLFSQKVPNILHPSNQKQIDWLVIEINLSDNYKDSLLNKVIWHELDHYLNNHKLNRSDCHFTDFNEDGNLDLIVYFFNGVNYTLSLYLNEGGNLQNFYRQNGLLLAITEINRMGHIQFEVLSYYSSSDPVYGDYKILSILPNNMEIEVNEEITSVFGSDFSKMPVFFDMKRLIKVVNTSYHLRTSAEIDPENIIADFTTGDLGLALSSKEDETGRVWYFCLMYNNIPKTSSNFKMDRTGKTRNNKHLGWISSRYLEEIE